MKTNDAERLYKLLQTLRGEELRRLLDAFVAAQAEHQGRKGGAALSIKS